MKRSEEYVRWYRQACEAQDPQRPNLEDDLEKAMGEAPRSGPADGDDTRANPYKDKKGKFTFKPVGAVGPPPPAKTPAQAASARVKAAKKAEPALTSYTGSLAKKHGGKQAGLDFRLKTEASLTRKIANDVREAGGKVSPEEVAGRMFDVNRYTTVFPEADYASGAQATLDSMRADGHTLRVKNYWANESNPYQGINVQVVGTDGNLWELQFHTDVSLDVKETQAHAIYEQLRVETDPVKAAQFSQQLADTFGTIPIPPGVMDVG